MTRSCRFHHPPVRHSVPTETVGTLVPHGKAGVFTLPFYKDFATIRELIAQMAGRIEKTAWQLNQYGSEKAAGYLYIWLPSIVTFAEAAIEEFGVS